MKLSFRYAIAAIVMAGALFLLSPTLMPEDVNLPGASRISLGLDLKGGVQLTLGVGYGKSRSVRTHQQRASASPEGP